MTVGILLAVLAFILAVVSAAGRVPLWAAVILLSVAELLRQLPR